MINLQIFRCDGVDTSTKRTVDQDNNPLCLILPSKSQMFQYPVDAIPNLEVLRDFSSTLYFPCARILRLSQPCHTIGGAPVFSAPNCPSFLIRSNSDYLTGYNNGWAPRAWGVARTSVKAPVILLILSAHIEVGRKDGVSGARYVDSHGEY